MKKAGLILGLGIFSYVTYSVAFEEVTYLKIAIWIGTMAGVYLLVRAARSPE